jgi:transaldolase
MTRVDQLKVKIFADGANFDDMLQLYSDPMIQGFTTNPTLMRKAGVTDYERFARDLIGAIPDRPISFEVFADEFDEMEAQATEIASWGENVFVKIPVTNTRGESSASLLRRLSASRIRVNVTAVLTLDQVRKVADCIAKSPAAYISVFAGRIADTGRDPVPIMASAVTMLSAYPNVELIWASPRELLNIFQASGVRCHVITVTSDVLKKLKLVGKDLNRYSLETVQMFYEDARKAGYQLGTAKASQFVTG